VHVFVYKSIDLLWWENENLYCHICTINAGNVRMVGYTTERICEKKQDVAIKQNI